MDARALIRALRRRGVSLRVAGERITVEAPEEPDAETQALIAALADRRAEVRGALAAPEATEVKEARTIQAVKICSRVLEDEIWLILDRDFIPRDGLACYYPEEIPALATKTAEELRQIHNVKLTFPGARVIQDAAAERGARP